MLLKFENRCGTTSTWSNSDPILNEILILKCTSKTHLLTHIANSNIVLSRTSVTISADANGDWNIMKKMTLRNHWQPYRNWGETSGTKVTWFHEKNWQSLTKIQSMRHWRKRTKMVVSIALSVDSFTNAIRLIWLISTVPHTIVSWVWAKKCKVSQWILCVISSRVSVNWI